MSVNRKEYIRQWKLDNPDKVQSYRKRHYEKDKQRARDWYYANRDRTEYQLYKAAKNRAAKFGIEFNIEISDIVVPSVCPILGTEFVKHTMYAASIDRIDNDKGYVKGNIAVMSRRANTLKSDATPSLLRKIADWMESQP